jgi:hypothetical protein
MSEFSEVVHQRRLENYVPVPESGCWIWLGKWNKSKYGQIQSHGKRVDAAHRFFYEHFIGQIPEGLSLCHKCDTPPCCNPEHMFVGTQKDNLSDMQAKNRGPIGDKHGKTKITDAEVMAIRSSTLPNSELCRTYDVVRSTISTIRTGNRRKLI